MSIVDALKDIQKVEKACTRERQGAVQKLVEEGATRGEAAHKVYFPRMSDAEYADMRRSYEEAFGTR